MLKRLITSSLLLASINFYAMHDDSYANGWYWGQDNVEERKDVIKDKKPEIKTMSPKYTQKQVLSKITEYAEEAKAATILNPTVTNMHKYLVAQNRIINMSSKFSDTWKKTMLKYPELDFSATNPSNNYARKLLSEEKQSDIKNALIKFSKEYGLVFFFSGADKISTYQSKVVSEFAANNNITLIPVSMTGEGNQYITNPALNHNIATKMNVRVTPAVIALNSKTKKSVPLVFGVTTQAELATRIYNLYQKGF